MALEDLGGGSDIWRASKLSCEGSYAISAGEVCDWGWSEGVDLFGRFIKLRAGGSIYIGIGMYVLQSKHETAIM
jgi:hypothetical protein